MGLGTIAAGLVVGSTALSVNVIPLYAKVGPAAFLWFSGGLLVLCGALVAWYAQKPPADAVPSEIRGPLVIMAGLIASPLLMGPLGFIPTATVIFTATAYGLGSRRTLRDAAIGAILSTVAFFVFAHGLNLRLPMGTLFS